MVQTLNVKNPLTGMYESGASITKAPTSYSTGDMSAAAVASRNVTPVPKTSTTTLSNANVIDNVIPSLNNNLNAYNVKGATTLADGTTRNADGSVIQPKADTTENSRIVGPKGEDYTIDPNGQIISGPNSGSYQVGTNIKDYDTSTKTVDQINAEADTKTQEMLDNMKASTDATTAAQIENIKAQMAIRKKQQEDINLRQKSGVLTSLLTGGITGAGSSAQFAPISSEGTISAQETYGIQQLAQLDAEENNLISQANAARDASNYKLLEKKLDQVETKRKEKVDAATKLNEEIAAKNKKLQEQTLQSNIDNTIAEAFSAGATDPAQLLAAMNAKGWNLTAKQVQDSLASISKKIGVDTTGMTADLKEYYSISNQGLTASLPASILALPEAQRPLAYVKYKADLAKKATKATTEKEYSFSNDDKGKLIGTGLSNSEIEHIQNGINEYGVNEVLAKETGLTEDQKNSVLQIVSGKTPEFINETFITDQYDNATLRKAANKAGYNAGGGLFVRDYGVPDDQLAEFKKDLLKTVDMYRKMGIPEKDIQAKLDKKIQDLAASY